MPGVGPVAFGEGEAIQIIGEPPSTLSTWLHGAAPAPEDLAERIEAALDLKRGSLAVPSTTHNDKQ